MTLRDYIDSLVEFGKENPEALDLTVVYSKDDEGNGYGEVYYGPSIGGMDSDGDFTSKDGQIENGHDEYDDFDEVNDVVINSVCIN